MRKILWIAAILMVLPFIILAFFAYPVSDDFHPFYVLNELGESSYAVFMYNSWSGRFAGNFIAGISPLAYGRIELFFLLPLSGLLAVFFALKHLLSSVLVKQISGSDKCLLSLVAFAFLIYILPSPASLFYWGSGVIYYALPLAALLFSVSLFVRLETSGLSKTWRIILTTTLFITAGFNELFGVAALVFLLALAIVKIFFQKSKLQWVYYTGFAALLLSLLIVAAAPGNGVRINYFSDSLSLFHGFYSSLKSLFFLLGWLFTHPAFILSLLLSVAYQGLFRSIPSAGKSVRYSPALIAVTVFLISFSVFFTICFMQGCMPPLRVFNPVSVIVAGGAVFWVVYFSRVFMLKFYMTGSLSKGWKRMLIFLFAFLLIFDFGMQLDKRSPVFRSNISAAWYDTFFEAGGMRAQNLMRKKLMETHNPDDKSVLYLSPLKNTPVSIYNGDISYQPSHWINTLFASIHGVDSVALRDNHHTAIE